MLMRMRIILIVVVVIAVAIGGAAVVSAASLEDGDAIVAALKADVASVASITVKTSSFRLKKGGSAPVCEKGFSDTVQALLGGQMAQHVHAVLLSSSAVLAHHHSESEHHESRVVASPQATTGTTGDVWLGDWLIANLMKPDQGIPFPLLPSAMAARLLDAFSNDSRPAHLQHQRSFSLHTFIPFTKFGLNRIDY